MKKILWVLFLIAGTVPAQAQSLVYPHPVKILQLSIENMTVRMAYMDVQPTRPNG